MATIATYQFDNSSDWDSAKGRIGNEVSDSSSWNYDYGSYYYYIYIYDSCEKASLVGQICRAHGGKSIN